MIYKTWYFFPSIPSLNDKAGKVSFIDYEYGDYNYQECDIANHFDEMAGVEEMDFLNHYPTKEFQLEWIRAYLEAYDGDIYVPEYWVDLSFDSRVILDFFFLFWNWAFLDWNGEKYLEWI